jgi:diguanylate cyclase (GGDEF)-like protein
MTLYRQISFALLLLVLLALSGTLYLGITNLQDIYEEQLAAHAQDTAASLALAVSPYLESGDRGMIKTVVNAVFDQGDYLAVEVTGTDGSVIASRARKPVMAEVPDWFRRLLSITATASGAPVMSGRKPAGVLRVTPDPSRAYVQFWEATVNTLYVYAAATLVLLALAILSVRLLLRPLQAVSKQADAICNNRYPAQEALPRTRELRSIVSAMNRLSAKVNEIFSEQTALTEAVREQVYLDPLTAVGNRRYFERILPALVEDHDQVSAGALLMLELHHLSRVNDASGYPAGDRVLQRTAGLLRAELDTLENCYLARISGTCFAIIAVGFQAESADALAMSLCHSLHQLRADGLVASGNICHIGIAMWRQGYRAGDLVSEADMALRSAQSSGLNTWQRYDTIVANQSDIYGASRWRAHIRKVIDEGSIQLAVQPVMDINPGNRHILHHEVLTRIPDPGGTGINAALFMPMAERLGLASQLDKLTISTLLDQVRAADHSHRHYAVNLSSTSLHDSVFIQWLCSTLARVPRITRRIKVEFPEYGVLANLQNARNLITRLSELGIDCGIDHFGRGFSGYGYLRSIGVRYLKIDATHLRNIESDRDSQFFIQSLADTMHSIGVHVYAMAVETNPQKETLERMHIDGIQGYLIGRPELMEPVVSGNILQE